MSFTRVLQSCCFLFFSGSGNLSTAVKEFGIPVYAVDSKVRSHGPVAIHALDLTRPSDVSVLLDLTCHANIASAHLAPPCASSRARERPLPDHLSHIRAEPLRSDERPLGLEGPSGLDAVRVGATSKLYALTIVVLLILFVRGALLSQLPWLRDLWGSMEDDVSSSMYVWK